MYKNEPTTCAGIDVSKDHLDVYKTAEGHRQQQRFKNTSSGHRKLTRWLRSDEPATATRVVVESTGRYGLDLCLALHEASSVEVMVANPKALRSFAGAQMRRTKTDALDAEVIAGYARRMPFRAWNPPSESVLELRAIARRIQALTVERTREKNRLHAVEASRQASDVVTNDLEVNLRHLACRIEELVKQTLRVVHRSEVLGRDFQHLTSVRGIGEKSAILLLGELAMLPDDMTVREWVAHAGLDPRKHQSGSSVEKPERISKVGNARIRRALYMPAQVALQYEPNVRAFYEKLLARGKKPIVAVVAVMRKLLHAIYGMMKHDQDFQGEKFYHIPEKAPMTT